MNNQPWIWRRSSRSAGNGECVEVAQPGPVVGLRDSKNPTGGHLTVLPQTFAAFLTVLCAGTEPEN